MLSIASFAALPRRDLVVISTCIVAVVTLAWAYLVHLDRQMSASMSDARMMAEMGMAMNTRWTPADAGFTFAMWTVMMIGMMAGSVAPLLLLFARVQISRGRRGASLAVLLFGLGYLAVWTGFSALATCAQWALHQAALLSPAMAVANPRLAGVVLLAAGAYQLTPWKGKCLTHCRTPLGFLMTNWRDGMAGAFLMGARHGAFCLGCCWALMCVLFAMGVMNLVWVAALTGFVLLEKIGPAGVLVARLAGVAMAAFGILRFAAMA